MCQDNAVWRRTGQGSYEARAQLRLMVLREAESEAKAASATPGLKLGGQTRTAANCCHRCRQASLQILQSTPLSLAPLSHTHLVGRA